jgi:hypothetical protein
MPPAARLAVCRPPVVTAAAAHRDPSHPAASPPPVRPPLLLLRVDRPPPPHPARAAAAAVGDPRPTGAPIHQAADPIHHHTGPCIQVLVEIIYHMSCDQQRYLGMHRISGWPDNPAFLRSGIRPDLMAG